MAGAFPVLFWFYVVCVVCNIPSINVVFFAIAIIVFTIAWNLIFIDPNIIFEVLVVDVNSAIDDSYDDVWRRVNCFPGFRGCDVGIGDDPIGFCIVKAVKDGRIAIIE